MLWPIVSAPSPLLLIYDPYDSDIDKVKRLKVETLSNISLASLGPPSADSV